MSMTRACPGRRSRGALLLALILAWPLCVAARVPLDGAAQVTSGVKRLQRQQQRDSSLHQNSIREQQRQRSSATGQAANSNRQLQRQLDDSDAAQHRQYQQHRQQKIREYPDLPPPADTPVPPADTPAKSNQDQTSSAKTPPKVPASARSSG